MLSITTLYSRAGDGRVPKNDPDLRRAHRSFFAAAGKNFLILQLLFLCLFCYIFGSLFQQTTHVHNLHIAFLDYDGGAVGQAVRDAYAALQGPGFPTLVERDPSDLLTTDDLVDAVCRTRYWAALYVSRGASDRLRNALVGDGDAAAGYENSDAVGYVWNEARYAATIDATVSANIQALSNAARVAYATGNGTGSLESVSGLAALSVLAEPWKLKSINIQPTTQGSRAIYNTIVIVLVLIQEFFYLGTINGLYIQFNLYHRASAYRSLLIRTLTSLSYTFIGSLCVIGTIWAFKSGWDIHGSHFVLAWLALWLFAHTNFLTLDVCTIWLPHPFVPMALVTWIILNVTSVLLPLELSPAFYRIGYIFPAHEVFQVLTDIWSHGCNPRLHYALPILFSWEVVAFALSALGVFRRSHLALIGEEKQKRELQELVDAAVELELARKRRRRPPMLADTKLEKEISLPVNVSNEKLADERDDTFIPEDLAAVIRSVTARQQHEHHTPGDACCFGPSFNMPFTTHSSSEKE